jgi:eukaryotic-like serine/threonine-protein kinase
LLKFSILACQKNDAYIAQTIGYRGTPLFSAPEQNPTPFNSSAVTFTKAIDTYAFGVTAIYLSGSDFPDQLKYWPHHPIPSNFFSKLPITLIDELATLLASCLSHDPDERPSMTIIRDQLSKQLLHDKHQALAVYNNQTNLLNSSKRTVTLRLEGIGEIRIEYDGYRFYIASVSGEVFINNQAVSSGEEIPGSCVVALGATHRKNDRKYITFDVSNPEVVI